MSRNRVAVPPGETMSRLSTEASSMATVSQPGMNDGGFGGPLAARSVTAASRMRAPSAEMRPARISSGS